MEIWKNIEGFHGYQVSNLGRVRSFWISHPGKSNSRLLGSRHRILKTRLNDRGGYEIVGLSPSGGKRKTLYVHKLVYKHFRGDVPTGMVLDHADGNRTNNYVENLRVATVNQNLWNAKPRRGRQYKGITKRVRSGVVRWEANIRRHGKHHYLGQFLAKEDAAKAYNDAAVQLSVNEDLAYQKLNTIVQ